MRGDAARWWSVGLAAAAAVVYGWWRERWRRPVLVLDAGHGGGDPGVTHGPVREADLVLMLAREVRTAWLGGAVWTRAGAEGVALAHRVAAAERGDVCVSLHVNGHRDPQANGAEVIANAAGMPYAARLAQGWLAARAAGADLPRWRRIIPAADWRDGAGRPGLWIDRVSRPVVLVEFAFLTNAWDRDWLQSPARRAAGARVVAAALWGLAVARPAGG